MSVCICLLSKVCHFPEKSNRSLLSECLSFPRDKLHVFIYVKTENLHLFHGPAKNMKVAALSVFICTF